MKQKLLLMVLALGMCSAIGFAQEKEYHVEDDGFEWYKVSKYENGERYYGAQDKFGNTLIPTHYCYLHYTNGFFNITPERGTSLSGLADKNGNLIIPTEYTLSVPMVGSQFPVPHISVIKVLADNRKIEGIYDTYGRCIIPISRGYYRITMYGSKNGKNNILYLCQHTKGGSKYSFCDATGKCVFTTSRTYEDCCLIKHPTSKKYALIAKTAGRWSFIDKDERTIWNANAISHNGEWPIKIKTSENGSLRNLTQVESNKILFSANWLDGNSEYFAHASEYPMHKIGETPSSNSAASSNTGSNSNNNPGGGTTTVVVEHQYTPQPVQEWQACFGCGGMGTMGCDNCGGSGTKYIGDSLHRCSRCNGQGIIPCNICYGSKGKYVTVYR